MSQLILALGHVRQQIRNSLRSPQARNIERQFAGSDENHWNGLHDNDFGFLHGHRPLYHRSSRPQLIKIYMTSLKTVQLKIQLYVTASS